MQQWGIGLCTQNGLASTRYRPTRQGGLSLIELLTALVVAAIVMGVAIPSFQTIVAQNRLAISANSLMRGMAVARRTAITREALVTFCAGSADTGCDGDWTDGEWIVFVDHDGDGQIDKDETLKLVGRLPKADIVSVAGNGPFRKAVVFTPGGTAQWPNGAFAAGRIRVCADAAFMPNETDLVLIGSGRVVTEYHKRPDGCADSDT